jgi:hypothetical protein
MLLSGLAVIHFAVFRGALLSLPHYISWMPQSAWASAF